jgi:adenylate kinase
MVRGELVPDDLVVEMVRNAIAVPGLPGFVLDGFPRTLNQATAAHEWGRDNSRTFHAVISLVVPEDESVRRMLARSAQSDRNDDVLDTIMHRLKVYDDETQPLLDYYRDRGILLEIDGIGTVADVAARIDAAIAAIDTTT